MDFSGLTSATYFWENMGALLFVMIVGALTRSETRISMIALTAAVLGTGYAGVIIAVLLSLVTRLLGVVKI